MPMRVKAAHAASAAFSPIPSELLEQFVTGPMTQQGIEHLGYRRYQ